MSYAKLVGAFIVLAALGFTHFLAYNKGKDSATKNIFSDVAAGTAVAIKMEEKNMAVAIKQSTEDTAKLTRLEHERNALKEKLNALAAADPRPTCLLADDELRTLQALADQTKP
jgi:hypothetical protein